jgi:hypothetical protein
MHLLVTATSLKVDTLQYLKREKDLDETPSPLENRCVIVGYCAIELTIL